MNVITARVQILTMIFLVVGTAVTAHPHIWIDNRVEVRLNGDRIEAIRAHWTFDPFFSQSVLVDVGRIREGRLSTDQVELIRRNAFENLRNYGYFTYIRIDGRDYPVRTVERFDARINEESNLVYSFDLPLDVQVGTEPVSLRISMYDETFFTDFAYEPREVLVSGTGDIYYFQEYTRDQHIVPIWGPMQREMIEVVFRK